MATLSWLPSPTPPAKCCGPKKAPSTRLFIAWKRQAGFEPSGSRKKPVAAPASMNSPSQARSNSAQKSRAGSLSAWQSIRFFGRPDMSLWSRVVNVFRPDRLNREIDEKLQAHIDEAIASGRDPVEARRAFGSPLRAREAGHSVRAAGWLQSLVSDTKFGWSQLWRN